MDQQSKTSLVSGPVVDTGSAALLYQGVKSIVRCDEAEVVSGIAGYVVSQHLALRLLSALIERTRGTPIPAIIALIGWLRCFIAVRPERQSEGIAWIARLGNERRALEKFAPLIPDKAWTELKFHSRPDAATVSKLWRGILHKAPTWRRVFRLARLLDRRYEFFKVLRVVELIGYYSRYLETFQRGHFSVAVMSSHSNPHGIAFNLAARKCGVPTVLITHGMPVRPVARLSYDLAVVHCEAARQTYQQEGCHIDRVLIHGRLQNYAPMPAVSLAERLVVGIFLCKDVNERRLRSVVEQLLGDASVSRVFIRPHPKNLWVGLDAWIDSTNDPRLSTSTSRAVFRDLEDSDIVLGGNSSVLVDAVTAGRPSGYVPGLDHGTDDLHALVAHGLIYPIHFDESDGQRNVFDFEAMLRFYQQPDWPTVLRLFANIDEDELSVNARVAAVMRELSRDQKSEERSDPIMVAAAGVSASLSQKKSGRPNYLSGDLPQVTGK